MDQSQSALRESVVSIQRPHFHAADLCIDTSVDAPGEPSMTTSVRRLLLATVAIAVAASLVAAGPARAADPTFSLTVNDPAGWGPWDDLRNPGPTLSVDLGDNVTLLLNASDGSGNHRWFIDYDNDTTQDPGEPASPNFAGPTQISWNFTADRNGTFLYRDRFATNLTGTIEVLVAGAAPAQDNTWILVGVFLAIVAGVMVLFVFRDRFAQKPGKK